MKRIVTLLLSFACLPMIHTAAHAADYTFAPAGCEFAMTFPEQPTSAQRCSTTDPTKCTDSSVFVQVYDIESSLNITVTCTPAEDGMLKRYSGDVMRFTLQTMAKDNTKDFETGFNDYGHAKQALLLGSSPNAQGGEDVYMAQLWIGETSVLTVEGRLIGNQTETSDAIFTGIMKSIAVAPQADTTEPSENKEKADKEDKKTEE